MSVTTMCAGTCPSNVTGMIHLPECTYYTQRGSLADAYAVKAEIASDKPAGVSSRLDALIKNLHRKRGDQKSWFTRLQNVNVFIAQQNDTITRIICRGEVRPPEGLHHPAVLIYSIEFDNFQVWASEDPNDCDTMTLYYHDVFYPDSNIQAHIRESLNPETKVVTIPLPHVDKVFDGMYIGRVIPKVSNLCSEIPSKVPCSRCGIDDMTMCDCGLPGLERIQ